MSREVVQEFVDAFHAKDFDRAVALMTEDAQLETPIMGTKKGHKKIRGMLRMIEKMGGGTLAAPEEHDGNIYTKANGPIGTMMLNFQFEGDKICYVAVQRA